MTLPPKYLAASFTRVRTTLTVTRYEGSDSEGEGGEEVEREVEVTGQCAPEGPDGSDPRVELDARLGLLPRERERAKDALFEAFEEEHRHA